jgi:putative SOS response-associated peptidase YedK
MCGRMSAMFDAHNKELQKQFMITKVMKEFGPRYNVAPSQIIPVIIPGSRILDLYKWGLIPYWAKEKKIGNKMINARAETLNEKPSFKDSFHKRRCLIPSTGFYEWDAGKTPHLIYLKNKKFFAFAGLFDEWIDRENKEVIKSCTIITTDANPFMKKLHHRMPVILKEADYSIWLNPDSNLDTLQSLLKPIDSSLMQEHEVSQEVNSPKNDTPKTVKPLS